MATTDKDLLERLLKIFKVEAEEHIKAMTAGMLALEKGLSADEQQEVVETIFREAHSLKGAARSVNLSEIETVCQALESVYTLVKQGELILSTNLYDSVHRVLDVLSQLAADPAARENVGISGIVRELEGLVSGAPAPTSEHAQGSAGKKEEPAEAAREEVPEAGEEQKPPQAETLREEAKDVEEKPVPPPLPEMVEKGPVSGKPMGARAALDETVRISTGKLDSLLLQTEEMTAAKLMIRHDVAGLQEARDMLAPLLKEWERISPEIRKIRLLIEKEEGKSPHNATTLQLERLPGFYDRTRNTLLTVESRLQKLTTAAHQHQRQLSSMIDTLVEDMKNVLMFPFASSLEIFPKLVRDLSRDQGKEVALIVKGGEIEIDRRILEQLKDPLVHMVRNCIDHGLETTEEREKEGKERQGTISITVSQADSKRVEIVIADDGRGIAPQDIREAMIKKKVLSRSDAERLNEEEILSRIFQSGVSTMPIISDISGRGLGLAIVQEKAEGLGGYVRMETKPGHGSVFRLVVPVTLSTFSGVLVRVGDQLFIIPTMNLETVMKVDKKMIKTVENRETISWQGNALSLVRLSDILELVPLETKERGSEHIQVAVLNAGEKSIAFQVDKVLHEQEVLLKGLGRQLARVRNCAGSTVLGSGKVVPILNVRDLIKSLSLRSSGPIAPALRAEYEEGKRKSALVVEDSITSRMMLKNILESAGYEVKVAIDGIDGFTVLNSEEIDVVVSDIDMPRMNGFDMVTKIRDTKKFADLPIVLVTALDSREDRERGIEVGADAYIVKSSFDQSNLLSVLERLL